MDLQSMNSVLGGGLPRRFCFLVALMLSLSTICQAGNLYCGERDCYDILELTQAATDKDIKKSYRKFSLQYHPDRNPDDPKAASDKFTEVARAYEILIDPVKRADYDYYIENPTDYAYNYAAYYSHTAPKSNLWIVLVGFAIFITTVQYLGMMETHRQAVERVRRSKNIRLEAQKLITERKLANNSNSLKMSKKSKRKSSKEEEEKEVQEAIEEILSGIAFEGGHRKPQIDDMVVVKLALIPYYLWNIVSDCVRYQILRRPYTEEKKIELTHKALGVSRQKFLSHFYDDTRDDLISRELWLHENLQAYQEECVEEFKRKHPEKYKRQIRERKRHVPDYGWDDED